MAIPHPPRPENYGNHDLDPRWEIGEFKVGIISFVSGDTMSVCVGCNRYGRAVNVVINQLYHVRILEEHEYSKLATSLKKGCQTNKATSNVASSEEKNLALSHTIEKRVETYPVEAKSY